MTICENRSSSRQYLIPVGNEVAAIMSGQGDLRTSGQRDIVLHYQDGRLQRISNLHRSYMPLLYVLLFPRGEDGWHLKLPYADVDVPTDALTNRQCVSQREYYAYRLQVCLDTNACFLRGGRLLQQFMVDAYCTIEDCRLSWVRNHQHTLRAELYAGLIDMARSNEGDILGQSVGRRIVLPSPFTVSTISRCNGNSACKKKAISIHHFYLQSQLARSHSSTTSRAGFNLSPRYHGKGFLPEAL
ncbi:hypothetical protein L7F22_026609 [Adiantum nelumboides]|nr:hypothetical protein [Adiantum nelumboides]